MPATAEQLLDLLEAPHFKAAGSTSTHTEGPTARPTEASVPLNLTVTDHVTAGRRRLAAANTAYAYGHTAHAEAMRRVQHARSSILLGDYTPIRQTPCPSCGTYGLLWRRSTTTAVCVNTHCSPIERPRQFPLDRLMSAPTSRTRRRFHSGRHLPADLVDAEAAAQWLGTTGKGVSRVTLQRIARRYKLAAWKRGQTHLYSRSDLLVAHALNVTENDPKACASRTDRQRPACTGMADLFHSDDNKENARRKEAEAKQVCATCPLLDACRSEALRQSITHQYGVFGGLTASERRALLRKAPAEDAT